MERVDWFEVVAGLGFAGFSVTRLAGLLSVSAVTIRNWRDAITQPNFSQGATLLELYAKNKQKIFASGRLSSSTDPASVSRSLKGFAAMSQRDAVEVPGDGDDAVAEVVEKEVIPGVSEELDQSAAADAAVQSSPVQQAASVAPDIKVPGAQPEKKVQVILNREDDSALPDQVDVLKRKLIKPVLSKSGWVVPGKKVKSMPDRSR